MLLVLFRLFYLLSCGSFSLLYVWEITFDILNKLLVRVVMSEWFLLLFLPEGFVVVCSFVLNISTCKNLVMK